ncbi:hypothetical protein M3A76_05120 [Corynebacterium sanguinis]|uniref:hypothetical protein n=1 Tax=Corynebacterium sanguinis TaxID=2594913 RepID=UPI0021A6B20D|nr:hypothetical protein [Corynebacterium sanguinis]MCT1882427.1 hypothetical protein [Corynebacterium sanguinis]
MRTLWFVLAAAFSLVAVGANWLDLPRPAALASIAAAAVFLVLGFRETYRNRVQGPVELDAEQEETIRQMKAEGNTSLAIRQVQMWFRYASAEDAARAVREL